MIMMINTITHKENEMKTISTKYVGPTNTKGSRIIVTDGDNKTTHKICGEKSFETNCVEAATLFAHNLGWTGTLQGGHTKDGMVFTFDDPQYKVVL